MLRVKALGHDAGGSSGATAGSAWPRAESGAEPGTGAAGVEADGPEGAVADRPPCRDETDVPRLDNPGTVKGKP